MAGNHATTDARPSLIFSVDVECWAQSTLDPTLPISEQAGLNTRRLLDILAECPGATGTFFILGLFADKHPDVVRDIQQAGHEIGSHGYGHVQLHLLKPDEVRADVKRAIETVANIGGVQPRGYRAPVFSIGAANLWALDILAEEGFIYDSSIFPIAGPRYGIARWPTETCRVQLPNGMTITEFPLTAKTIAGRNLPVSGGGYARLFPGWLLKQWLQSEAARRRTWPVFYCHPYEIDPDEFRRTTPTPPWGERTLPLKTRLHQGLGRRGFADKLRLLMKHFRFRSYARALEENVNVETIQASDFAQVQPIRSAG